MRITTLAKVVIIGLLLLAIPKAVIAQRASVPYHKEAYILASDEYAGLTDPAAKSFVAFRQTVRIPGAPWLQLHFGEYNLGRQSYIIITSLKDGHQQRLDAKGARQWQDSTAYFNGDGVEVELHVAPGEKGIFVRAKEVVVGEVVSGSQKSFQQESICGTTDDRVASNDPGVGRILPSGCTGWIVSNGATLTAGHCAAAGMEIIEFNVPASNPDGTINHPAPQHQYPITSNVYFKNDGLGKDWAIFECGPNTNTGLLPAQAQGAFFRMSIDRNPANVRVTGYGVDGPGPVIGDFGTSLPRNADSQTQQTHVGPNLGENVFATGTFIYRVDTQTGNDGSPIIDIDDDSRVTIGIHTNGGCTGSGGRNLGTSFESVALKLAVQTYPGANVTYVDRGARTPLNLEDGTVFRPYHFFSVGVSKVAPGGILSIVTGDYFNDRPAMITKPMTIIAPVGVVTLGRDGPIE